ncbi:ABC transporter ATP-binding protein [Psychroflexus sp. CAK8W]|uniref:ABC transporter ATP-binding protein n=1 Tax=Psychroflexus longus TaxID=2873596 RepID=A0ABS7XHA7_9FLAO|nr:ABC transporter ATP-binding protein [Psychroflexus longus]MBZ9777909.1 ABC transporter ATP-binding protein [Psychroflexus longus]
MLNVSELTYLHENGKGVSNINFELKKGDHLALIGESGCGKSTLIKSLYGLFDLDKGSIKWRTEKILGPAYNLVPGYKKFKHLSQEFDLMPFTTSEENIQKFLSRETPEENQRRSDELIALFDLDEVKHQKLKILSGGQKQRVAIAQALANPPELILLDEPFSHIDQFLKHRLRRRLFQFLKKEEITCIFATHDADDVLPFSDFTMVLKEGKALDFRTTQQVYNRPKNEYCASLFGDVNVLDTYEFNLDLVDERVVIFPHEIRVVTTQKYQGKVLSSYFKGSHYLIEIDFNSKSIFAISTENFKINDKVNFDFDRDRIKNRLN